MIKNYFQKGIFSKFRKKHVYNLLIIFLIGLLPILWLPGDKIIIGHDSGIPLEPITHFLDRLSVWSQRLGIGTDQSYALLGALFIHGIEAFLAWVGFNVKQVQVIQFVFWLTLPGVTMYYLASKIWPDKKYLPLIASVIYMLNFYLIQAWFVAERTKFSLYAAVPLVVYFAISYLNGRMSFVKTGLLTGVTLAILNGGGSFPLYGGLIIAIGTLFVYQNLIFLNKDTLKRTFFFTIGVGIVYALLNAYWLIPYIYYIFAFYSRDLALAGGAQGALSWTTYLSKGSTFINLFRGQGIPDWYLNLYHPFASAFFTNPILIIGSFLFPILAYIPLLIAKTKKDKYYIYLFVLISLITLIFAGGTRSQLGALYEIIAQYVPGFAIFRSAYYKFDYAFWLSIALLIGFSVDAIFSRLERLLKTIIKKASYLIPIIFSLGFVSLYLLYHFPVLNGIFLDYSKEPGKELTTRVSVPQYIFDFADWMNQQDPSIRYLVVPELNKTGFISYDWGYWSAAPITSVLVKNSMVRNTFLVPGSERFLMEQMYDALLRHDMESFNDFTEVFAIDGIVVMEDFDWQNPTWGTTNPSTYIDILDKNPNFKLVKTFGKWKIYDIVSREESLRITASSTLSFLSGELKNIASFPHFNPTSPLFMADLDNKNSEYFFREATDVFLGPQCVDCNLEGIGLGFEYYNPTILPGSFLYPLIIFREEGIKNKANDFSSLTNYFLTTSDRRIVEAKWMVDSKQKLPFVQEVLDRYYKTLIELDNLIARDEWGVSGKDENDIAERVNAHLLQQATFIESIYDVNVLNVDHRSTLANAYEKVLKLNSISISKQWATKDIFEKRYIFDLPKLDTSYEVYVKKGSLADENIDAKNSSVELLTGEKVSKLSYISEKDDWLYFGKITPREEKLRLSFLDSTVHNIVDDVLPVFPETSLGINEKENGLSLTTDSRDKCFYYPVKNLETGGENRYKITFKYRNLTDEKDLGFYVSTPNEEASKLRVKEVFLPNSRQWREYSQQIITKDSEVNIYFCNGFVSARDIYGEEQKSTNLSASALLLNATVKDAPQDEVQDADLPSGQAVIELRDIALYKISSPNVVLYLKRQETTNENFVSDFKKNDTVSYTINTNETKKPVTLIMRESYGKYWRICQEEGCMPFEDKNHFASAGFANGWYFKNGLKGEIKLFYYPQRMYQLGAVITISSILLLIGGLCIRLFKNR